MTGQASQPGTPGKPRFGQRDLDRSLITPEGVPLRIVLADAGERATALVIDLGIMLAVILGLLLVFSMSIGSIVELESGWIAAFLMLAFFLVRNFYFTFFELRWRGQTPGKRLMKLRVIDAQGGPLTAEALIARNLMRELEIFVPLSVVLAPESLWPGAPGWARLVAGLWAMLVALLPLFNRDRLRPGDMVGGTLVILAPRAVLLPDLVPATPGPPGQVNARPARAARMQSAARPAGHVFTPEQLDVYGIYELQVLEGVLRRAPQLGNDQAQQAICEQIKTKIGWDRAAWQVEPEAFLQDFYQALRAHLERKMLFGDRREDKHFRDQEDRR